MNANQTCPFLTLTLLLLVPSVPMRSAAEETTSRPGRLAAGLSPVHPAHLRATPRGFIPNVGQVPDAAARFILREAGVTAYFTDSGFVFWNGQTTSVLRDGVEERVAVAPRWELVGARQVQPTGGDTLPHTVSYFLGNDPSKWRSAVPAYRELRYPGIQPGVEMRFTSGDNGFEYSFHVEPGARPDLRFRYHGIRAPGRSRIASWPSSARTERS